MKSKKKRIENLPLSKYHLKRVNLVVIPQSKQKEERWVVLINTQTHLCKNKRRINKRIYLWIKEATAKIIPFFIKFLIFFH